MKSTGMVRKVDELGRIVIPKELRNHIGMPPGTPMEIFISDQYVVLRKYQAGCALTGEITDDMIEVDGVKISRKAAERIAESIAAKLGE